MKNAYRAEIDGLRALAVLPVMLFHAGIEQFSGGYVGVDVFFVISGYLITSILLAELAQGSFSLVGFYERRARRILPALFLVMLACIPFAWAWMTPDQLRDFGRSLVAVTVFGSNLLFWIESGYFGAAAEVKPLLHTWSLAVEEQYYVVFPLLMMGLWRFGKRRLVGVITAIAVLSFALSQFGGNLAWLRGDPDTSFRWMAVPEYAFYLTPARAWELLLGALCAFYLFRRPVPKLGLGREAGAATGIALICYSIVAFDRSTPFPGAFALVPTIGTALIILFATTGTAVARLLSARALVGVGLISYSAYLWHQPLFAFARLRTLGEVPVSVFLVLTLVALALAYLSWRFVEKPFRTRRYFSQRQVFTMAACASTAMLALGLSGHITRGFADRYDPGMVQLQSPRPGYTNGCNNAGRLERNSSAELCILGAADAPLKIAVLGDSHASSLGDALHTAGLEHHIAFVPVNDNWCAPLYQFGTSEPSRNPRCRALMTAALDMVAERDDIETVILVAEWANYTTGVRWGFNKVASYTSASAGEPPAPGGNPEAFDSALQATLARLAAKQVVIVKSVPEYHTRVPDSLAKAALFADGELPEDMRVSWAEYLERNRDVEVAWSHVPEESVTFVETGRYLCRGAWCRYMNEQGTLYLDDNHLSQVGAEEFVKFMASSLPGVFPAR
jgi:peptidoglycan/LPS O-acetylase OafA/YrhL